MSSSPLHDQESDDDGSSGDDPLFKFQSRGGELSSTILLCLFLCSIIALVCMDDT